MRKNFRVRDMVLSMAALGVVVAVMYVAVPRDESSDGPQAVHYQSSVPSARRAAPYPVLAPEQAPHGWRPTSVRYKPTDVDFAPTWHLGFLTPGKEYAAVEQGKAAEKKFAADRTQGAKPGAPQRVNGTTWTRWSGGAHGYRGLVRSSGGATTAVVGTASFADLGKLAADLKG